MGFYVRDQWQIGQKLTASFGLRWEYYPVPVRADRGVEHFDLATNRVLMCGIANNSDTCGVTVQKDLFTPRLGIAYRPFESFVIRAGYSRNPQNDHMYRGATYTYPASITLTQTGLELISAGRHARDRLSRLADSRLQLRFAGVASWRRGHHGPRQLHSGNHHGVQRDRTEVVLSKHERSGRIRGEPPARHGPFDEPQLRNHWWRRRQSAVLSDPRHDRELQFPRSARQGRLRLTSGEREPPLRRRAGLHRRLRVGERDRRVGDRHPDPGIPVSE